MRKKTLLLLGLAFITLITLLMLTTSAQPPQENPLLGTLKLQEEKALPSHGKQSLRYRAPSKHGNPFLALYQEKSPVATPAKTQPKTQQPQKETQGFFSAYNTDQKVKPFFFTATSQKQQPLQDARPIQLLLKDPIDALDLPAGTLLKGLPTRQGHRIKINITAGIVHGEVRPLNLLCFDPNDCLEGLFDDQLQTALENDIQDAVLEELLDFDFTGAKQLRKAAAIASNYPTLQLEKGREVLIALPQTEDTQ
ncbi:MAG: conjugative transposon protein TraM [Roseivirga sp.]